MGIFKCNCKNKRIISCDKKARYYVVQCIKCGKQETRAKAAGEEYQIGLVIK